MELSGDEARHAVTVSRMRAGERIAIGDGRGIVVHGVVDVDRPARARARGRRGSSSRTPPAPRITLVQALAKGDRDELAVQAATELGVDAIVPWAAARSVSRWEGAEGREGPPALGDDRARGREAVDPVVAAARRARHRDRRPCDGARGQPDAAARADRATALTDVRPDGRDLALVVGPEGGIAPAELERLVAAGAEPVRLGASVLRTSTAGPAAIAVLNAALGRW